MSNKRITDLTELTTPTTDDVFPVVDIATNTTTKVQLANLPVQTAVTTALATKQATLVSGTNIKTVNSTTLLGSGDVAVQPTLVSGTNIKTLNSVSLLGAGDIVLAATPSGVAGAIQFSDGSAFASDATNFFWNNTTKRLGVGTNAPTASIQATTFKSSSINDSGTVLQLSPSYNTYTFTKFTIGAGDLAAQLGIKGSGSTSATTSLLVQNSSGINALRVNDDLSVGLYSNSQLCMNSGATPNSNSGLRFLSLGSGKTFIDGWSDGTSKAQNYPLIIGSRVNNNSSNATNSTTAENGTPVVFGSDVYDSSALVQMNTTTRGFLPPRMTTTQRNAIASPAAGLMIYNTTTAKLNVYTTAWETITSL
jgi:hypothetical protein